MEDSIQAQYILNNIQENKSTIRVGISGSPGVNF
jgi:hypothetical protein